MCVATVHTTIVLADCLAIIALSGCQETQNTLTHTFQHVAQQSFSQLANFQPLKIQNDQPPKCQRHTPGCPDCPVLQQTSRQAGIAMLHNQSTQLWRLSRSCVQPRTLRPIQPRRSSVLCQTATADVSSAPASRRALLGAAGVLLLSALPGRQLLPPAKSLEQHSPHT